MDLCEINKLNINRHLWELSRRNSILSLLKRNNHNFKYADIGSGDMYFIESLKQYTINPIYAVDVNYDGEKNHQDDKVIILKDILQINEFELDCVFLMDVLEHIKDENSILGPIKRRIGTNCEIIVTVPAYQFLFSDHDYFLKHYRRYNSSSLISVLKKNGYYVKECFYFYISLFIIRSFNKLLSVLFFNKPKTKNLGVGNWPYASTNVITIILINILNLDFIVCRYLNRMGLVSPDYLYAQYAV